LASKPFVSRAQPLVFGQRLRRLIREPGDITLALQLGYFIWRVPDWLDRMPLPQLLNRLASASPPASSDIDTSLERVKRLSRLWFKLPMLRNRNTCYLRALMFFRFLDPQTRPMHIHFVVEPGRTPGERLRGRAWVTIGETLIDPPPEPILARTRSIYSYPPLATAGET
jgi:hypothetical protein